MYEITTLISIIILSFVFYLVFYKSKFAHSNTKGVVFIKAMALIAGSILVYFNLLEFNLYQERKSWIKISGEIISFDIIGIKTREPEISYLFKVNDSLYTGKTNLNTPFFGSRKYQEQTARTISREYQVGDIVAVYYNPYNPKESALKISPAWSTYMQMALGIFIVSITLAFIMPAKSHKGNKS